jgi:hypothetical protein
MKTIFYRNSILFVLFLVCASASLGWEHTSVRTRLQKIKTSPAGQFLIQIIDEKSPSELLTQSMELISNPVGHVVMGGSILAAEDEFKSGSGIPAGTIYRMNGLKLSDALMPGTMSVLLGGQPITFQLSEHRWEGFSMISKYDCCETPMVKGISLVREIGADRQGHVFISFKINGQTQDGRTLLRAGQLTYRLVRKDLSRNDWRIWYREPGGAIVRPGFSGSILECRLTGDLQNKNNNDFLIAVDPNKTAANEKAEISAADLELESRLSKSRVLSLMKRSMKRWVISKFPAWDSPEPWLNKLWAGEVFSICNQLKSNPQTGELTLRNDSPDSLRYLWDVRWLRDSSIGSQTLLETLTTDKITEIDPSLLKQAGEALMACQPDPEIQKILDRLPRSRKNRKKNSDEPVTTCPASQIAIKIADYAAFLRWCRCFYINEDYARLIDMSISHDGRYVKKNVPMGILDMVVTNVVGLKANGEDVVRIEPANWIYRWPYFAIDNLPYRGHNLTIAWQSPKHTRRYRLLDYGMSVFVDGRLIKHVDNLTSLKIELK